MGLYNFQPRFVAAIRAGAKTHTIRAPRKGGREDGPGDTMHLYTGLRHKGAERLLDPPPVCARVESIVIRETEIGRTEYKRTRVKTTFIVERRCDIYVGPLVEGADEDKRRTAIAYPERFGLTLLTPDEASALARRDGFESFADTMAFWNGRLPFYGHIFHWRRV